MKQTKEKVMELKREISEGKTVQLIDYGSCDGSWGKNVEFHYKNHKLIFTSQELMRLSEMFSEFSKSDKNLYPASNDLDA